MDADSKEIILKKARNWFRNSIAENHARNAKRLGNPAAFNINPFLVKYLANFLTGDNSAESIARALIYPRVLGTSITTSFGTNIQRFASEVLDAFGSIVPGIDIEFVDQIDQRKKYCQLKAGPNTLNKDDVESIYGHFKAVRGIARTNNLAIGLDDLIVGVLYGTREQLSGHYRRLENDYSLSVIVGNDFWYRLTGDADFYNDLINSIASVAMEIDGSEVIERAVRELAGSEEIQALSSSLGAAQGSRIFWVDGVAGYQPDLGIS